MRKAGNQLSSCARGTDCPICFFLKLFSRLQEARMHNPSRQATIRGLYDEGTENDDINGR